MITDLRWPATLNSCRCSGDSFPNRQRLINSWQYLYGSHALAIWVVLVLQVVAEVDRRSR